MRDVLSLPFRKKGSVLNLTFSQENAAWLCFVCGRNSYPDGRGVGGFFTKMADLVYDAAFDGRAAKVRRLIDRGADVHWKEANGATPLHVASQNGHNATVKTLLAANAQVDAKRVSAHRTPSLERVPAAPLPSRLSLPRRAPPSPCSACRRRVPPLVGSEPIRRMADGPLSSPPQTRGMRRSSRRSSPPRRTWTPSW